VPIAVMASVMSRAAYVNSLPSWKITLIGTVIQDE